MSQQEEKKQAEDVGYITRIVGPLVVADNMYGVFVNEVVRIGKQQLVGEVIKLDGTKVFIQVYGKTVGLSIGDIVIRTRESLSVELGPGILENIFDGIQRPLQDIAKLARKEIGSSAFIPRNIAISALNRTKLWQYTANEKLQIGYTVCSGDIIGTVYENESIPKHKIMVPPKIAGTIVEITKSGKYNIDETLLVIKHFKTGKQVKLTMTHVWPVRIPRPCIDKLCGKRALLTGQRVLDALFPIYQGGTCAMPGACGKSVILQSVAKHSNCDCVIYVGCGERGNELAEIMRDFPQLTMLTANGKEVGIMKHTCLVGNTSNMSMAAREASIYTGITMAEYFRDQDMNVVMIADSISRWAEALREISNRLGEMPADRGYPAYLATRLTSFYQRAGLVKCIGNPIREGSVTIISALSPPAGDFADPVVSSALNTVQVFWGLDRKLAQRKHFPSVNWLISFTKCRKDLEAFFNEKDGEYTRLRKSAQLILSQENELSETVKLVGKDSLSEDQKLIMEIARILREDFLQQNLYTPYDFTCPLEKTIGMLKVVISYYENAKSLLDIDMDKDKTTLNQIKLHTEDVLIKIINSKRDVLPRAKPKYIQNYFKKLTDEIKESFIETTDSLRF